MSTPSILFVRILLLAFGSLVFHAAAAEERARPNILILLGDDIDYDTLGPWGGQAHTPNLDQLAADGMRFDKTYANVAMCAPFRQEFFSGRSAWRTRAMPNHSRSVAGTKSLPHYLRPLGYKVGLLGKSHIGPQAAYPFDKVGSLPMKEDANELAVKRARAYMTAARNADAPFCLVLASHDAHGPYTHGDVDRYDQVSFELDADVIDTPEYRDELARHFAEVTNLDALLGRLRAVLNEEKLSDNTLVLFSSEQGNTLPFSKWTCFDDGLASGIVAAYPGVIPAGKHSTQMMWIADLAPTLVEAAGGKVDNADFDGRSQWANFTGGNKRVHDYAYGAFSNCNILDNKTRVFPIRSIRDDRYTLIWSPRAFGEITSNVSLTQALQYLENEGKRADANTAASWVLRRNKQQSARQKNLVHRLHNRPEWALYDRRKDPEELTNLVGNPEFAEQLAMLKTALTLWLEKWDDADPVATEKSLIRTRR